MQLHVTPLLVVMASPTTAMSPPSLASDFHEAQCGSNQCSHPGSDNQVERHCKLTFNLNGATSSCVELELANVQCNPIA